MLWIIRRQIPPAHGTGAQYWIFVPFFHAGIAHPRLPHFLNCLLEARPASSPRLHDGCVLECMNGKFPIVPMSSTPNVLNRGRFGLNSEF